MLACTDLLEHLYKGSALELLKSVFNAENFICRLSWSIFKHFVAIHCWNVHYSQKFGGSRSFNVIDVDKTKKPVISACYDMQHICIYLHTRRANSGKITFLRGGEIPLWCPHSRGTQSPKGTKFCHNKMSPWGSQQWRFRDFNLHCFDTAHECEGQTDGRLDDG